MVDSETQEGVSLGCYEPPPLVFLDAKEACRAKRFPLPSAKAVGLSSGFSTINADSKTDMGLKTKQIIVGILGLIFLSSLIFVQWMEVARKQEEELL